MNCRVGCERRPCRRSLFSVLKSTLQIVRVESGARLRIAGKTGGGEEGDIYDI